MKKFLFICKERKTPYGISFGLFNSAKFVSETIKKNTNYDSQVIFVKDMNDIDREVTKYDPTHVFIEAIWITKEKFQELFNIQRHTKRQWIVRIHSKAPFLAYEGNALEWINNYVEIAKTYPFLKISVNNKEFFNDLYSVGYNPLYLPNIYSPEFSPNYNKCSDNVINIGCFGAIRPMKNHLQQAIASIIFANRNNLKLKFHINGNRLEQNGEQVLKNLRALFKNTNHEMIEHDWMNHEDFIKLVRKMDLGLQISFSESFNIVAADFVANNVPVIVSKDFTWMPFWTRVSCTNTESIVNKMTLFYDFPILAKLNNLYLREYNRCAIITWMIYVNS